MPVTEDICCRFHQLTLCHCELQLHGILDNLVCAEGETK